MHIDEEKQESVNVNDDIFNQVIEAEYNGVKIKSSFLAMLILMIILFILFLIYLLYFKKKVRQINSLISKNLSNLLNAFFLGEPS